LALVLLFASLVLECIAHFDQMFQKFAPPQKQKLFWQSLIILNS